MEENSTGNKSLPNQHALHLPDVESNKVTLKFWQKHRYIVVMLAFCGSFTSSIMRVNMSIAVVAMTSNRSEMEAEFDWDSKFQGYILSSTFYGSISTIFLGGWLSSRIGGKKVFGIGIAGLTLATLITPPLVRLNVYCLIALRFLGGLFQGLTLACGHDIWSKWIPPLERSKLTAIAYAGYPIGIAFGMFICGIIADGFGWTYIFYATGVIGLMFTVLWFSIVTDDPANDPKISDTELKYIKQSLGVTDSMQKITHPWKAIFTSSAVWAIIIVHFSKRWGAWTIYTQLPKFINNILNIQLEKTGLFSALPYLFSSILLPIFGHLADYFRTTNALTTTQVRKIFTCFGLFSPMICMIFAAFCENKTIIVICIILCVPLGSLTTPGFAVNHLDIAPQHASVLLGISATAGMIPGIVSPILTGYIVQDGTVGQWRIIFIIASVIYLVGGFTFAIFASGEKQKWAQESKNQNQNVSY